jgi:LacI family transcriptional regulator
VVGFDDIVGASTNSPPLTTVRQPMQEMGRAAATAMLQRIGAHHNLHAQAVNSHSILVLPTCVERKSTAPVP